MTAASVMIRMLDLSRSLILKSVSDFSDEHWSHQPIEGLSCAGWIVGHAVLVDRHVLEEIEDQTQQQGRFLPELPDDWNSRFTRRLEDQYLMPSFDGNEILAEFLQHRRALVTALSRTDEAVFDRPLEAPPEYESNSLREDYDNLLFEYRTVGEMVTMMALYTTELIGELSLVRHSLGMSEIDEAWP